MTFSSTIQLASGKRIGTGHPCFMVAEIGNNHQGDENLAREMLHAALEAGADAVKLQKRCMDAMFTKAGLQAPYTGPNSFGATYGQHRQALELDIEAMARLKNEAEDLGLVFFASAWDSVSAREMLELGMELFKVPSADLVNLPLLRQAGEAGVPVVLSTGMSSWPQIDAAVAELLSFHENIVILHCNSTYPCPNEDTALPVMQELSRRYGLPVGYSGHDSGIAPSLAAVALGACMVERHFTLDRDMRGTDHQASLTREGFAELVRMAREVEAAMSQTRKRVHPAEEASAAKLRKSLVFARDLPAGHLLTAADVALKCPGTGLSPLDWDKVMGARLERPVRCEELVDWRHLSLHRQSNSPDSKEQGAFCRVSP